MKSFKKIGLLLITVAAVASVSYKLNDVKRDKIKEIEMVNKAKSEIPVTTVTVTCASAIQQVSYPGTFEPLREVSILSEAQGKVTAFSMEEGMYVAEGKVIATVENEILSYQMETAEAAYRKAETDLQRFTRLSPGEAVTTQQLEEVKLGYQQAKSNYLIIKKQYENTYIKAPVSGNICRRYIERGSFIAPGSPVADLMDTRKMKFNAWFSAKDLVYVKAGDEVTIGTDLYPGVVYNGVITLVGMKPDESKRYRVQAEIVNNTDRPLISGTGGILSIQKAMKEKQLIIPRNCILGSVADPAVYVVENGITKRRKIVVDRIVNSQAIVADGLKEGDAVVLSGQINLDDNTKVRVTNSENNL
ncbi:MAG TPA: efflux RND transporter periplasmic adaptor subunit [Prolixibacteraceae bacterium]|nr:efflux RND transporter periplasmic adaptor subunit [Prolixibacteraceae bacterium]